MFGGNQAGGFRDDSPHFKCEMCNVFKKKKNKRHPNFWNPHHVSHGKDEKREKNDAHEERYKKCTNIKNQRTEIEHTSFIKCHGSAYKVVVRMQKIRELKNRS